MDRIDIRDYPEEALCKVQLNALPHQNYSFSGSTLISIFDDQIEFVTIGGLIRGLAYNDIMLGISVLRDKKLANVFYRLNLIEAYGTGILKIKNNHADCDVKPQFEVTDNAFKIALPNINYTASHKVQPTIPAKFGKKANRIRITEIQGAIVRKDVEAVSNFSLATAILLLRDMVESALLVKAKDGRPMKCRSAKEINVHALNSKWYPVH